MNNLLFNVYVYKSIIYNILHRHFAMSRLFGAWAIVSLTDYEYYGNNCKKKKNK